MNNSIRDICEAAIRNKTAPGMVVGYVKKGSRSILPFGHLRYSEADPVTADTIYDVASITKSIPTACLALKLIEDGELTLDDKVIEYVPELDNKYREDILVRHLLTYTVIFDIPGGLSRTAQEHPHDLLTELFKFPLMDPPGARYHYTNAPAILLGLVVERCAKSTLAEKAGELFDALGMGLTTFQPTATMKSHTAPSEVTEHGELLGVVQDEAARALAADGRFVGDAGLFSTAGDILTFAEMLLGDGTYRGRRYFKPETVTSMHTNQLAHLGATTALGWEMAMPKIMGRHVSEQAFGKTGFTGCMVVIDPGLEAALVVLSNRTYPRREATRDDINAVRRALADIVFAP